MRRHDHLKAGVLSTSVQRRNVGQEDLTSDDLSTY
jgi:hypothetical protein